MSENGKKGLTFNELIEWIEQCRVGFYLGCRMDEHSPQVNEFVRGLHYYLEQDFGYLSEYRKAQKIKESRENGT